MFQPLLQALLGTLINQDWRSSLLNIKKHVPAYHYHDEFQPFCEQTLKYQPGSNWRLFFNPTLLSISIYLYHLYLSVSICIYLYLSVSICIYLYLSVSICIYLYLSVSNILHIQYTFFLIKKNNLHQNDPQHARHRSNRRALRGQRTPPWPPVRLSPAICQSRGIRFP